MIFLRVETFYEQHPTLMVREHRRAIVAGHYSGGQLWADRLLPEHFRPQARSEFGYFERDIKYRRRKIRLAALGIVEDGGRQDLVKSGATRRAAAHSRYLVKATAAQVDIPILTPQYITMRPNRFSRRALGLEILAMSPRHERLVENATGRGFDRHHRTIRAAKRTVIKS